MVSDKLNCGKIKEYLDKYIVSFNLKGYIRDVVNKDIAYKFYFTMDSYFRDLIAKEIFPTKNIDFENSDKNIYIELILSEEKDICTDGVCVTQYIKASAHFVIGEHNSSLNVFKHKNNISLKEMKRLLEFEKDSENFMFSDLDHSHLVLPINSPNDFTIVFSIDWLGGDCHHPKGYIKINEDLFEKEDKNMSIYNVVGYYFDYTDEGEGGKYEERYLFLLPDDTVIAHTISSNPIDPNKNIYMEDLHLEDVGLGREDFYPMDLEVDFTVHQNKVMVMPGYVLHTTNDIPLLHIDFANAVIRPNLEMLGFRENY